MRNWRLMGAAALGAIAVSIGAAAPEPQRGRGRGQAYPPGQCPAGTTEVRPGMCQAPELPPPSILDYKPRSTLVTKARLVPRARYPFVDIHSHTAVTAANIAQMIQEMDAMNLRVLVNLSGGGAAAVAEKVAFIRGSGHADRFAVFANVNWRGAGGAGWAGAAVADLERAVRNGAVGLKVAKDLGLSARKADGTRLRVDDPVLGPVWEAAGRLDIPVIIHTAEPQEFFSPLDYENERWLELALFENRRNFMPGQPTFDDLMGERDRMFAAHPNTRFINAHFGWYANNLPRAAKLLAELPNVVMEVAAVLYDFGRQPRAAREFFTKYQDRVLMGKDSYQPSEFPYYFRVFETDDEYFDYYRNYHAFWKLYGLGLSDEVLAKLYYRNALRVTPGLPKAGFPR